MSTQDDRTATLQLKKPHPTNLLADDVGRLRDALDAIDAALAGRPAAASVTNEIQAAIQALIGGAPGALDTLNELAAALNDDANFAGTVANQLSSLSTRIDTAQATADLKATVGLVIALG